jgi:hypothetical protein
MYQFWRTVEAWIELDPEELLYVEGAEDFDIVGSDEATPVQVKDDKSSGSLTLASANATTPFLTPGSISSSVRTSVMRK